jgi:hypothetical protein
VAALAQTTGDGLMALLKPQVCALYAREGSAFGLLYAGGRSTRHDLYVRPIGRVGP